VSRTVALTGATGLLGGHLRAALRDRRVVVLSRRPTELASNETRRPLDLAAPVELDLPTGSTLVHLVYVYADDRANLDYTRHLIEAVNRSPEVHHVVLISSVSVYGWSGSGVIDETTPCRPDSEYATIKLECEQLWRELLRADCRLSILRPSIIVAPGGLALQAVINDALHRPLLAVLKRTLSGRSSMHFVAVHNVVEAIRLLIDHAGDDTCETFIVADDDAPENATYGALQDAVRAVEGRGPLPTLPFPAWAVRRIAAALHRPFGIRHFSTDALRALGYQPPSSLAEEISRTVHASNPALPPSP